MRNSPRVLLVGAGAVGQVFAKHLQAAGCEVGFLVKEAHAAEARAGFTLHAYRGLSPHAARAPLQGVPVLISLEDVAARRLGPGVAVRLLHGDALGRLGARARARHAREPPG